MIGVYAIRNLITGDTYIGSSKDIDQRWAVHRHTLKKGISSHPKLMKSWLLYGANAFEFLILEQCASSQLRDKEQRWFTLEPQLNTVENAKGGRGELTEQGRQALVENGQTRPITAETRQKLSEAASSRVRKKGEKRSPEARAKMRAAAYARNRINKDKK